MGLLSVAHIGHTPRCLRPPVGALLPIVGCTVVGHVLGP